jgi:hypothetical protein
MRGRIEIIGDIEPPPEWWADAFRRRQRRLRALVRRHLDAAGGRWLSTVQVRSLIDRYEPEELDHALAALEAGGVVESESRVEPYFERGGAAGGRRVRRTYWRLPAPEGEPCPT